MKINRKIDWLSLTYTGVERWQDLLPFRALKQDGHGRHGYGDKWYDKETGATIETAAFRDEMGTHFTLSGDVLEALRQEHGMDDDALIRRVVDKGCKCSRIDLAIDCFGANFVPKDLSAALDDGSAKIKARKWRFIAGHDGDIQGDTVDTGSPKSDKRLRFYDKTAEQKIKDGEAWVRLELQLRRMYARAAVKACRDGSVCGATGAAIGEYLQWSNDDYQSALVGPISAMQKMHRKETHRREWLLGQVSRALASELRVDPDFRERFDTAVGYWLDLKNAS